MNLYDYGARWYDASIGRWNAVDPLIEKHYDYTPYAYDYNNPMKFVDPFGLDTLLVDSKGRFAENKLKGGENDVFIKVTKREREEGKINYNKKGELRSRHTVSKGFEKGSLNYKASARGVVVQTTNEQSEDVFNYLVDNTEVEFSRIEYENNGELKNIITSSHEYLEDPFGSRFATQFANSKFDKLISHTHNHPEVGSEYPSSQGDDGKGDIPAYQEWIKLQGSSFRVFIRFNGVTREFYTNGKPIKTKKR